LKVTFLESQALSSNHLYDINEHYLVWHSHNEGDNTQHYTSYIIKLLP